jgi:hypothetical protein
VAELVQHYLDCGEGVAIYATTGPAMREYEVGLAILLKPA